MKLIFRLIFTIIVSFAGLAAGADSEDYIHYLAGVTMLRSDFNLTTAQKTVRYLELEKVTGVSSSEALKYIETFRDRPLEWKKIQDKISGIISGTDINPNQKHTDL